MTTTATIERHALAEIDARSAVEYSVETVERPDGPRERTRAHRRLETVIRVAEGVVYLVADDDEVVLTPGDEAVVPAGVPHRRWNAGDDDARFVEIFRRV